MDINKIRDRGVSDHIDRGIADGTITKDNYTEYFRSGKFTLFMHNLEKSIADAFTFGMGAMKGDKQ